MTHDEHTVDCARTRRKHTTAYAARVTARVEYEKAVAYHEEILRRLNAAEDVCPHLSHSTEQLTIGDAT